MLKRIASPGSYIQGKGEIHHLAHYYRQLGERGAYIVASDIVYDSYGQAIASSFEKENIPYTLTKFGGECSMVEINMHCKKLGNHDAVIGMGGGKTLDTAKAIGYYMKVPVLIAPTIASSDAPCSRLSVLYKENGEFEKYLPLPANPNIVLMDTEIISQAPVRFLSAGIGDALATYYEAAACAQSNALTMAGGQCTKTALCLAKLCLDTLLENGELRLSMPFP